MLSSSHPVPSLPTPFSRHSLSIPSPMAVAYRAPTLCLSCAADPAASGHAASHSLSIDDSHLVNLFAQGFRGSRGLRARNSTELSPISAGERRDRRRQGFPTGKVFCASSSTHEALTASAWSGSVLLSEVPVLVEFWASWCGPCKMVRRMIDELAKEYTGKIKIYTLNTDEHPQVASFHSVDKIPTVLLFKNGEKLGSLTGTLPKSIYVKAIEKTLTPQGSQ